MSGTRDDYELAARELARESSTVAQRNPTVRVAPDNQRRCLDGIQASAAEGIEPELPEHRSQGTSIVRIWNRRVILIDVRLGDFARIGKRRAHDSAGDPASTECRHDRAEHG